MVLSKSSTITQTLCDVTIQVGSNVATSSDWRAQYSQYSHEANSTLTLEFTSLQEALLALNTTIMIPDGDCIDIFLAAGSHTVYRSIYISQNISFRMSAAEKPAGSVTVDFSDLISPQNVSVFYAITIFGAQMVGINGIQFLHSSGIIAVEKVTTVMISDCNFK